jgi:hypothetical protein
MLKLVNGLLRNALPLGGWLPAKLETFTKIPGLDWHEQSP